MNGDIRADFIPRFSKIVILGEVLGRDVLPFHRRRFISLLENVLPQLSEEGAIRAGTAIERQCWKLIDLEKYPNSIWVEVDGERVREANILNGVFNRLINRLETHQEEKVKRNCLASLSQFPHEFYNDELKKIFFDSDLVQYKSSSYMAIRFFLKSLEENDHDSSNKMVAFE